MIHGLYTSRKVFATRLLHLHEGCHELIKSKKGLLHRFVMRHNGHFCGVFAGPRRTSLVTTFLI